MDFLEEIKKYFNKYNFILNEDDYGDLERIYTKLEWDLEQKMKESEVIKEEGNVCVKNNKLEEALCKYTEALDICRTNTKALLNRSHVAYHLGVELANKNSPENNIKITTLFELAVRDCERGLEIDPTEIKFALRLVELFKKQPQLRMKYVEIGLKIDKNHEELLKIREDIEENEFVDVKLEDITKLGLTEETAKEAIKMASELFKQLKMKEETKK